MVQLEGHSAGPDEPESNTGTCDKAGAAPAVSTRPAPAHRSEYKAEAGPAKSEQGPRRPGGRQNLNKAGNGGNGPDGESEQGQGRPGGIRQHSGSTRPAQARPSPYQTGARLA